MENRTPDSMEVKHELPDHSTYFSRARSEDQSESTNHSFRCTHLEPCGSIIVQDCEQERPLWRFTCYGHWKHAPCDIVGDISYEELRAAAYDDAKRGSSLQSIVARERNLLNSKLTQFENLCKSHAVAPNPAPAHQNPFISILEKTDTFPETGSNSFSQTAQGSAPTPLFSFFQPGTSFNMGSGWRPPAAVSAPLFESKHLTWERQDRSLQTQSNDNAERAKDFVDIITGIFDKDDLDIPVSIFKVPDSLTQANTEAYVPKLVGLGAIHHLRPELQQMQMYKVMEAKRIHKGFQCLNFRKLIELLKQIVAPSVRASYNMYLDITDDSLACIMAVDGLFLFYLLCCYGIKKEALSEPSFLSQMVDSSGRRLAQETTLREAMMLENQIPIHVLKTILVIESSEIEIVSKVFPEILMGFCQFVSPFDVMADYPRYKT